MNTELQKADDIGFRVEQVIKEKGDKSYVAQKGHDNWFNSWIDKKDIIMYK